MKSLHMNLEDLIDSLNQELEIIEGTNGWGFRVKCVYQDIECICQLPEIESEEPHHKSDKN